MAPFKPQSQGGLGLEDLLAQLARRDSSSIGADRVLLLAYRSARAGIEVRGHDPGVNREAWRTYAEEMRTSGIELAQAAGNNDPLALVGAARRLEAICWKCHETFRQ
jgi:hypothetical protein